MRTTAAPRPASAGSPTGADATRRVRRGRAVRLAAGLAVALGALAVLALLSLAVGARTVPLGAALAALTDFDPAASEQAVVHDLRLPRTLIGLGVGAALGLAGALMQALTRNPLADPGLLGINAGAATAIVLSATVLDVGSITGQVWFAFAGAALAALLVHALGSRGRGSATPVRLALAGVAVSAALGSLVQAITLLDVDTFEGFRFWVVGSLAGRDLAVFRQITPFLAVGTVVGLLLARPLNALALGDDTGRAVGAHPGRIRAVGALAVTLLAGAATAAAGPIGFVGLVVPHMARAVTGPDQRWLLAYSVVLSPVLLLAADILGRLVTRPAELPVAIVTAVVGAPVFIALVRRARLAEL